MNDQNPKMLEQLRWLRRKVGLTQQEIGSAIGLGRVSYRRLERGERPARLAEMVRLADFYGLPLEELAGRETASAARAMGRST